MSAQGSQLHYFESDDPGVTVTVHSEHGVCTVSFGEKVGNYVRPLTQMTFPDVDMARQVISEALSKVVPLCMTDQQRIEDEL